MIEKFAKKLAHSLVTYPQRYVAIVLLSALLAGLCCLKLKFDSSYEALLPVDSPKLAMTDQVRDLTGGFRQLVFAIEGDSLGRIEFAEKLAAEVAKIPEINRVELKQPLEFFQEKAIWLLPTEEIKKLTKALEEAIDESIAVRNPMGLGLSSKEEALADEAAAWAEVNKLLAAYQKQAPYKDPYRVSSDNKYLFMTAIPSIKFSDMGAAIALLKTTYEVIDSLKPAEHGYKVELAGNLKIVEEQHHTMSRDLTSAAILALVLAIILVAIMTKKPKAPLLVALALVTGVAWTMAITALTIGHLNIITGFLVSVIVGLGIDFGIHIFIRYQQEMRVNPGDYHEAMEKTVVGLFKPTMVAALTTIGTFFVFFFADFRGFSEFGVIAALGVGMTFISTFLLLPALLVLFDHESVSAPTEHERKSILTTGRAVGMVTAFAALAVFGYVSLGQIEFKNDYKNLRGDSPATAFLDYVDNELGGSLSPTVFIFDSLADTRRAATIMREKAAEGQADSLVHILKLAGAADLVPIADEEQTAAVAELRELLNDEDLDEALSDGDDRKQQLVMARKLLAASPWSFGDLPPELKHRFSTTDGQKYLLYLWPHQRYEADYQTAAWETLLDDISARLKAANIPHLMADETLILAWVYQLILHDAPLVIALALAVTLLFLFLDFRSVGKTVLVSLPLLVGMGMAFGLMRLFNISLNMFNIIVLPSMIGIGIDNGLHIYHRYVALGKGQLDVVLRSVGAASFLASATTIIGFGSSLISHMPGLRSLGTLAIIGLTATFVSAVLFFPALLKLLERK